MAYCYRHPQVETGVNCTRCNRPICIACMVNAPVGYQCPDCASAGPRFRVRTVNATLVTRRIIWACVVVFLLGNVLGLRLLSMGDLGMSPIDIAVNNQWYRLVTAAFLHGGFLHIAFNMYALYALGPGLERFLGSARFTVLYFAAALGGGVASYMFSPINTLSVGASGAIFGLMAATFVIGRQLNADTSQIMLLIIINLVLGFQPGIDWRAHVGGAVTGAVTATALTRRPGASSWGPVVAVVAVLVALAYLRTGQILSSA